MTDFRDQTPHDAFQPTDRAVDLPKVDQRTGLERRQGERRQSWRAEPALRSLAVLEDLDALLARWLTRNPSVPDRVRELEELILRHQES